MSIYEQILMVPEELAKEATKLVNQEEEKRAKKLARQSWTELPLTGELRKELQTEISNLDDKIKSQLDLPETVLLKNFLKEKQTLEKVLNLIESGTYE